MLVTIMISVTIGLSIAWIRFAVGKIRAKRAETSLRVDLNEIMQRENVDVNQAVTIYLKEHEHEGFKPSYTQEEMLRRGYKPTNETSSHDRARKAPSTISKSFSKPITVLIALVCITIGVLIASPVGSALYRGYRLSTEGKITVGRVTSVDMGSRRSGGKTTHYHRGYVKYDGQSRLFEFGEPMYEGQTCYVIYLLREPDEAELVSGFHPSFGEMVSMEFLGAVIWLTPSAMFIFLGVVVIYFAFVETKSNQP